MLRPVLSRVLWLGLLLPTLFSSVGHATTWQLDVSNPASAVSGPGVIDRFLLTFDDVSQQLDVTVDLSIASADPYLADGFWLVLSNGTNPLLDTLGQYVILYGDGAGLVSAYLYNGSNDHLSYQNPGVLLDTAALNYSRTLDQASFQFSLDASALNSVFPGDPNYRGIQIGAEAGVWFHFISESQFAYNGQGVITDLQFTTEGYWDQDRITTTPIPEPSLLVPMAGFALFGLRRKVMPARG